MTARLTIRHVGYPPVFRLTHVVDRWPWDDYEDRRAA